jgi:hypothetical protein
MAVEEYMPSVELERFLKDMSCSFVVIAFGDDETEA